MAASDAQRAITQVWKGEAARVVAALTRIVKDLSLAEELAQDAVVSALEEWPRSGIPERPGAWLMTAAKHRALNVLKRSHLKDRRHETLAHEPEAHLPLEQLEAALDAAKDDVSDDVLKLLFIACHPLLSAEARVALTLRLIGGLSTDEIAHAFLVSEPTVAQRIVRAKKTLFEAQVPFELPAGDALGVRLRSVLEVVYLVFNEGYSASTGDALLRPALVDEALRLGRLLAQLAPLEPEAHSLFSLMALQASRGAARVDAKGEPVLLMEQDRTRWDASLIAEGLSALARARELSAAAGPYQLQAAIAACHARAREGKDTDWKEIAARYAELSRLAPSPVVELNRALAVSRADGPAAGLALLDALASQPQLEGYHLLPAARADLLEQLGRLEEARAEFLRAASLTENVRQRERLLERARRLQH